MQTRRFNRTLFIGLVLLAVANVTRLLLERQTNIGEDTRDGLFGFLMGLAIGSLLLGIWRMNHSGPGSDQERRA